MAARARCSAAHPDDSSGCDSAPTSVRVVDSLGHEALGCIHHGARMLASIVGARVLPGASGGAAIQTFNRARGTAPFSWLIERG